MPISPQIPAWAGPAPLDTTKIADLQRMVAQLVANNGIPNGGVGTAQIAQGAITGSTVVAGIVTAGAIAAGTITAYDIAANTINATNIAAGSITANEIYSGTIQAERIQASNIAAGTITSNELYSGLIQANLIQSVNIATQGITATNLAVGSVDASKISVSNLSSVSSFMGTVTGGIFQTGNTGARVMFGTGLTTPTGVTAGIVGIDASNNVTFTIDAATGNVALKGAMQQGSSGLGNMQGITQNAVLQISGANLIPNGSMDQATPTSWAANGGNYSLPARDLTTWLTAPASVKMTAAASNTACTLNIVDTTSGVGMAVTATKVYSSAVYFYFPGTGTRQVNLSHSWRGSTNNVISTSTGPTITVNAGEWTRVALENTTAPAGALTCYVKVNVAATGVVAGEQHNIDNAIFVSQPTASGGQIVTGSITAQELHVDQLSAITGDIGNITAGSLSAVNITGGTITGTSISGATITGATIQTAAGLGPKLLMDTTGLYGISSTGTTQFFLSSNELKVYSLRGGSMDVSLNSYNGLEYFGAQTNTGGMGGIVWWNGNRTFALSSVYQQILGTRNTTSMVALSPSGAGAQAYISVGQDSSSAALSQINVYNSASGTGYNELLLAGDNTSTFMRFAAASNLKLIYGTIGVNFLTTGFSTSTVSFGTTYTTVIPWFSVAVAPGYALQNIVCTLVSGTSSLSFSYQATSLSTGGFIYWFALVA